MRRILGFRNWNKCGGCISAAATPYVLHWFTSIAFKGPPIKKVADLCFLRKSCPKIKSAQNSCTTPIFSLYQWVNAFTRKRTKQRTCTDNPTNESDEMLQANLPASTCYCTENKLAEISSILRQPEQIQKDYSQSKLIIKSADLT